LAALLAASLLLLPMRAPAEAEAPGRLLDAVVAWLAPDAGRGARTLLTLSDLDWETRVAFISRGALAASEGALSLETLAASLEWLVAEHLLAAEADQLEVAAVDPANLERALEDFRARFPTMAAYEAFLEAREMAEGDLLRIFRRRLVVDAYLSSRLRLGLGMGISEAEVRRAYDARAGGQDPDAYEAMRPTLRAVLEKERREASIAGLVADARRRADVRILLRAPRLDPPKHDGEAPPWYLPGAERGG
jgi:hypothetical protein